MTDFVDWFAGGRDGYMNLIHCMNHDYFWIFTTVVLNLAVATGYFVIVLRWWSNERTARDTPARLILKNIKQLFLLCGICGYLFIPIKMVWPAWRLYDFFLLGLVYLTWSFALRARELRSVYQELDRSEQLTFDLEKSREENRKKSDFLGAISHDMKTPLNGLILQADLAAIHLNCNEPDSVRDSLEQIKHCARTTSDLLNHFLEVGRLDIYDVTLREDEFLIDSILASIADQFTSRAAQKGLTIKFPESSNLTLRTDRIMLERVLINLVDNAIKYTDKGSVEITVSIKPSDLAINVKDSGQGIAPENHKRIFDDFVQLNNQERDSRKGFGLGLSISRRLAERLGARLLLESELNVGSQFTIELPLKSRSRSAAQGAS